VSKLGLMCGAGGAALAALSLVLSPAMAASNGNPNVKSAPTRPVSLRSSTFTPAVSDPRLAAELARRGLQGNSFRLTPASPASGNSKAIRVAIRARGASPAEATRRVADASASPVTAITPTVYNLGVAIGWKRFALSGDASHIRGGAVPGGRESAEVGVSYAGNRFTARAEVGAARPDPATPRIIAEDETYSVGIGGSYTLRRNLDVVGGVKYKIQHDRLEPLTDQRRDSQAVYIGTAFRF
jgi:hypothetical protein